MEWIRGRIGNLKFRCIIVNFSIDVDLKIFNIYFKSLHIRGTENE